MIKKIALICLENKKLLVVHKKTIDLYISPGGKVEGNESDLECLSREIMEELGCKVSDTNYFKTFFGQTHENKALELTCYFGRLNGEIKINPQDNIDNYLWIGKNYNKELKLADLLKYQMMPDLINGGLM